MSDEQQYLAATQEAASERERDPSLWAKAMVLAEGDEAKAIYHYAGMKIARERKGGGSVEPEGNSETPASAAVNEFSTESSTPLDQQTRSANPEDFSWDTFLAASLCSVTLISLFTPSHTQISAAFHSGDYSGGVGLVLGTSIAGMLPGIIVAAIVVAILFVKKTPQPRIKLIFTYGIVISAVLMTIAARAGG